MRQFFTILFLFPLCFNLAEAQTPTFADPPGPENVLVVYNGNSTLSDSVMQYYRDARNIPGTNIFQGCQEPRICPRTMNEKEIEIENVVAIFFFFIL